MNWQRLHNEATDIIAAALHYQDHVTIFNHGIKPLEEKIEEKTSAATLRNQLNSMQNDGPKRYREDPQFHARVQSIVSGLMHSMTRTIEEEADELIRKHLARLGGEE